MIALIGGLRRLAPPSSLNRAVDARPIRIGSHGRLCARQTYPRQFKTRAMANALEAEDLRVPRVAFRIIASTRVGVISTPARFGRTWTRMVANA